jgi:predicted transcriptional regulator
MADPVLEALILQLVQWISEGAHTYESVMSAWRTSCPRLPVWEEANDRGLIETEELNRRLLVRITPAGVKFLEQKKADAPDAIT